MSELDAAPPSGGAQRASGIPVTVTAGGAW